MGLGDVSHVRNPAAPDFEVRAADLIGAEEPEPPRKGVVLAAGSGTRLSRYTRTPKMLQPLVGIPLVERAVRTLFRAGLDYVIVVYGAYPEVGEYCRRIFGEDGRDGRVEVVFAPRWREGNGASLAAVEPFIEAEERFISVSGDHFTTPCCISALMQADCPSVLVDLAVPEGIDISEATKVLCDAEGRVLDIGKDIVAGEGSRVCLDAGAHLLTPDVFRYLAPRSEGKEVTISDALKSMAADDCLFTVAVPQECSWQDIDTPEDLRWARRKVLRALRSPKDGIVARKLNRPLSLSITSVLARWRPSPNAVSLFALILAFGAAIATATRDVPGILAGILIQMTSIVDGVDGELARATFSESRFGRLLDGVLDRVGDVAILTGVAIRATGGSAGIYLTLVLLGSAAAVSLLSMSSKDKLELVTPDSLRPQIEKTELLIGNLLAGRDGRLLVVSVTVALGISPVGLALVVLVTGLGLVIRLTAAARLLRPSANSR
jgi:choline kinase/phosphatidylglycerophosphate synthase